MLFPRGCLQDMIVTFLPDWVLFVGSLLGRDTNRRAKPLAAHSPGKDGWRRELRAASLVVELIVFSVEPCFIVVVLFCVV